MHNCGWTDPARKGDPQWADYWDEYLNGRGEVRIGSVPAIAIGRAPSRRPTRSAGTWTSPTLWRARYIVNQIAAWDKEGRMPQLILICLPNDHTSGTSEGSPTPEACVADNDLAFGRIVEAFSHSSFWKETVIFGIEDDPQNGWDHVSGYRTTAYCASPYTKRGAVVSTQYNTTSLLRTIEQILGLPPMNQFDATATPMFDCFTETPDFTPFETRPQQHPARHDEPAQRQDRRSPCSAATPSSRARLNFRQNRRLPRGHAQPHPLARRQGQRRPLPRLGRDASSG